MGNQPWPYQLVAERLRQGAVIAYPTEGVWGLGCVPEDFDAVARLLALKGRPWQKGLILVASNIDQIKPYVEALNESELAELYEVWPGPVTYLLPRSSRTPTWVSGEHQTVAIRVSAHPVIQSICSELGQPIVSTSANPAGKPPAANRLLLTQYFADQLDYVVPGDLGDLNGPSEIRDLRTRSIVRGGDQ
ncbi:MAG: L-threonylcarbamoyladenylate synthase [Candidatus Azotimanducaceae bacterium]|jgi:L-threonylcarbamoyladenylate synthase